MDEKASSFLVEMKFIAKTDEEIIPLESPFLYAARVEFELMNRKGEVQLILDGGISLESEELEQFCRENKIYYF